MIAWAQDQATFSTGVSVVNVLATVRDKQGQLLKDLTKDDFVLEEDGRVQTIRYFSKQSDLALTMGLLVDVSGSEMTLSRPSAARATASSIRCFARTRIGPLCSGSTGAWNS